MKQLLKLLVVLALLWVDVGSLYGHHTHPKEKLIQNDDCGSTELLEKFIETIDDVSVVVEGEMLQSSKYFMYDDRIYTSRKLLVYKVLKGDVEVDTLEIIHSGGVKYFENGGKAFIMPKEPDTELYAIQRPSLYKLTKDSGFLPDGLDSGSSIGEKNRYFMDFSSYPFSINYMAWGNNKKCGHHSNHTLDFHEDYIEKVYKPIEVKTEKAYKQIGEMKTKLFFKKKN